ncbi:MAG: SDR family NAD(P)-dependent oxidoreductase [Elsteraceae bacterium]
MSGAMTKHLQSGRHWLILGASSSVARAFARQVAAEGAAVTLAGRDRADLEATAADIETRYGTEATVMLLDAADRDSRAMAAQAIAAAVPAGRLDVFLAFAAMPDQGAMEADPDLALDCIMATYTGAVDLLLRLAPALERAPGGRVAVLGSVAGDRGRLKNHIYGSAKAGLHAFTAGYRNRLFRKGVTVTTIKPGFLDTAMTWGLPGIFLAATPDDFARACLTATKKGKENIYIPGFWGLIMLIIQHIPEKIFKRLAV